MKKLLLFFSLIISCLAYAQDSAKVLFIGNSYTYRNNMPNLLKNLATSLGDHIEKDQSTPGGMTLSGHASSSTTYQKINARDWDFVVLQAQSQEPSFHESQVNQQTLPYAMQIADSVYANSVCSQLMFYMTWGRENGDPQWGPISTFEGMNTRLRSAYLRFADSTDASISAVGSAWKYVRDNHPTINLYASDGSHPSLHGSYLTACTFYASIFRKSPVGASFTSTLGANTAQILQNAAAATVLQADSMDLWNLRPASELISADFSFDVSESTVTFSNESEKATSYAWDFGNGTTSDEENPTIDFQSSGNHTVQLTASSNCGMDAVIETVEIDLNDAHLDDLSQKFGLIKIENGLFTFKSLPENALVKCFSTNGKEIKLKNQMIDLRSQARGMYLIQIVHNQENFFTKVIK